MTSIGWILWDPKTNTKGKTGGHYYGSKGTKVYKSAALAAAAAKASYKNDYEPREVFVNE